jgi:hypothetical protein
MGCHCRSGHPPYSPPLPRERGSALLALRHGRSRGTARDGPYTTHGGPLALRAPSCPPRSGQTSLLESGPQLGGEEDEAKPGTTSCRPSAAITLPPAVVDPLLWWSPSSPSLPLHWWRSQTSLAAAAAFVPCFSPDGEHESERGGARGAKGLDPIHMMRDPAEASPRQPAPPTVASPH